MRDHTKLRAFEQADLLAEIVYRESASFPPSEQVGLRSQIRRAAVSVVSNIVEGCARSSEIEYLRFLDIAYGSAKELEYQIGLCARLGFISHASYHLLNQHCATTAKSLCRLIIVLRQRASRQ